MSFPTLRELELEMEVSRLKAELYNKYPAGKVIIDRSFLNEDLQVNSNGNYRLNPFIEVRGQSPMTRGDNFITQWKSHDENGYHEILYKADFVTLTTEAANHVLESMILRCLHHIINSRRQS